MTNQPERCIKTYLFFSSVVQAVSLPWPTRVLTLGRRFRRAGWWKTALCVRITLPGLTWKMAAYLTDQPYTHSHALKSAYAKGTSKYVRLQSPIHSHIYFPTDELH